MMDGLQFDPSGAGYALALDGEPLAAFGCWLSSYALGEAQPVMSIGEMPGRAGGIDQTLEGPCGEALPGRRECEFVIATHGTDPMRAMTRLGRLAGKTVEVFVRELNVSLLGRLSVGTWDVAGISTCTLALDAEPYALGEVKTATSTVNVEGSAWAEPVFDIAVKSARPNVDIVLDGVRVMRVPSASGNFPVGTRIAVDSSAHTIKVNGNLACPTLDSEWPVLTPGAHAVSCEGCDLAVTWRERYMF